MLSPTIHVGVSNSFTMMFRFKYKNSVMTPNKYRIRYNNYNANIMSINVHKHITAI